MDRNEAVVAMILAIDYVSSITENEDGSYTVNVIDSENVEHNFTTLIELTDWLG